MNEEIFKLLDREQLILSTKQKRFAAFMIDEVILSVIWLSVIWDTFSGLESIEDKVLLINSYVLEFMALKIIYHTFFVMQYAASDTCFGFGHIDMACSRDSQKECANIDVLIFAFSRSHS